MCLPVWRELKLFSSFLIPSNLVRSHVPSRLEGIETVVIVSDAPVGFVRSHVPSRLEGIETLRCLALRFFESFNCSHVPSRLEGIETYTPFQLQIILKVFTCAFPFGGN